MSSKRALVVDDSKVGRLTMQKKLETFGIGVDLAESGLEALTYLERHRPDMIFMDHMMPDLDGFEATRRIKASPATRDIPVIIISGSDDEDFVQAARAIGALDVIAKPPANDAIERILVSLPQAHTAKAPGAVTSPAPEPQIGASALADQAVAQTMIEARLEEAIEQLYSRWLNELSTRLEAEFENQRQLQRVWNSRLEQRLNQAIAGQADISRVAAATEAISQQMQALETRLLALETADDGTAGMPESWLETVDQRVAPSLAELRQGTERQEARMHALRQELLQRLDERYGQHDETLRELAGRIESLSEAMQRHMANMQTWEDTHSQRLGAIEDRLATLEATSPLPQLDQTSMLISLENTLSQRLADMLRERQGNQAEALDRLRDQLHTLDHSQDALRSTLTAESARLDALMEARFAQIRAEIDTALQSVASGPAATPETALVEARVPSAAAEPEPLKAELATGTPPAVALDRELEARPAQRLVEEGNAGWQAEVERLQRRMRVLTLATAAGGATLLAALIILAV